MKLTSTIKFLFFFFLILSTNSLCAATIKSKQAGSFSDPKTWIGNKVPTSSDDIVIQDNVILDIDFTVGLNNVGSLTINATKSLVGTGKTVNLASGATLTNNGTLNLMGLSFWGPKSTFQNNGTATVNAEVQVNQNSVITNQGILNLNSGLTLNTSVFTNEVNATTTIKGSLTVNGTSVTNRGTLVVGGSTTINTGNVVNAKAATFTIAQDFTMNGGNTLGNYGKLKVGQNFMTNPVSNIENSDSLIVNGNLTNNSIFKNTFGKIVVKKTFSNSYSGDFTNDHGDILAKESFVNDYSGKFTNNYGLVTTSGNFTNRSKITGSYGGFKIAGHSENVEGASISGYVDITDTSLAANNTGYVDSNRGFIDIQTVTKNSYKAPVNSLPVTFILWKASAKINQVVLEWQTATEQNSDFFIVERSKNARDFTAVTSIKGAGNSQQLKSYQFTDKSAPQGTVYYRLKQVDFDGTEEYTKIINVESKVAASLQVTAYPNPLAAQNQLHIALNASKNQNLLVQIINGSGQIVYQQLVKDTEASQTITIPLSVTAKLKGLGVVRCLDENAVPLQITKVLFQ